ncbi:putative adenosine monophosphate-protein transferase Fic [Nitrincola sp. MINF-07-Sa-05]|uniref:putative adenosine monophosphate-protein transferase Fic n=1 Tax=Nitrincola salilacus TaxID=3400273 RepID=UPI0039180DF5
MLDKYGVGQDSYCYPGTVVLRNRLGILDEDQLNQAEQTLSSIAADKIDFQPPPYDFDYLKTIHRYLFCDLYEWAGEIRTVDISKQSTRFCTLHRIAPEAEKLFLSLARDHWLEGLKRSELVLSVASYFGDLNMIHPFREGNGRAQRVLFEHIIVNAGYEIDWWQVGHTEWIQANIDSVSCDYRAMSALFDKCIGGLIEDL